MNYFFIDIELEETFWIIFFSSQKYESNFIVDLVSLFKINFMNQIDYNLEKSMNDLGFKMKISIFLYKYLLI